MPSRQTCAVRLGACFRKGDKPAPPPKSIRCLVVAPTGQLDRTNTPVFRRPNYGVEKLLSITRTSKFVGNTKVD